MLHMSYITVSFCMQHKLGVVYVAHVLHYSVFFYVTHKSGVVYVVHVGCGICLTCWVLYMFRYYSVELRTKGQNL
jgi:hypothetical protein